MQLLPSRPPSFLGPHRVFRTSPWPAGLALLWMLVFAGLFIRLAAPTVRTIPWFVWLLAGPITVVVGAVVLLMASVFLFAWLRCFRSTNWIMIVARSGVYLNLRSYLNADESTEDPTVAFVPFSEIDSVRKVRESWTQRRLDESEFQIRCYLEIDCTADTAVVAQAVGTERSRVPPQRSLLGVKMRTKSNDVPVFVPDAGTVRVQWKRGMLGALEGLTHVEEMRKDDISGALTTATTEQRCLALLQRGEKIAAVESARQGYGVDLAEARRRVEQLEKMAS